MKFQKTELEDVFLITLDKYSDARGFFARAWCRNEFVSHGLNINIVQGNIAYSNKSGTIRGLHYQIPPAGESKIMRCVRGSIYDVIVDLRAASSTYKRWMGAVLSENNGKMLYVPPGFAHGYQTLEDDTEVFYLVSEYYSPAHERGIRWNDPNFGIKWPNENIQGISDKDKNWPDYIE